MAEDTETAHASQHHQHEGLRELFVVYLKGIAMGMADTVPGVSGGTIALIVGIYERVIRAVTSLDPFVVRHLPKLHRRERRVELWAELEAMDLPFLLFLGTGMVTAVIVVARIMEAALHSYPGPTFSFFFGLIAASAVVLYDRRWVSNLRRLSVGVAGFMIAFLIAGATAAGVLPNTLPVVFFAGMLAISGMVLPGLSGAFILLLLGQYDYMTSTLNDMVDELLGLVSGGGTEALLESISVVVTFLGGAVIGLLSVAYVIRWALDTYRGATFAFLVSLMIGALRYPAVRITETVDTGSPVAVAGVVAVGVLGAGAVLVLDRFTDDLEYDGV